MLLILPPEIIEVIVNHVCFQSLLHLRLSCSYVQKICDQVTTRLATSYLQNSLYQQFALRHCKIRDYNAVDSGQITDAALAYRVLHIFRCQGCDRLLNQIFFLDQELGGIGCVQCTQPGSPLQLVSEQEAQWHGLSEQDIWFLSSRRYPSLQTRQPIFLRLQDVLQLQDKKQSMDKEKWADWIQGEVLRRKETLLRRARHLDMPEAALQSLAKRRRLFCGPAWQFTERNLDHLLCNYNNIYKEVITMHVCYYYYQQTGADIFYSQLQMAYHSLYQKLFLESISPSWISTDLFLPQLRQALSKGLTLLEEAGLCPINRNIH